MKTQTGISVLTLTTALIALACGASAQAGVVSAQAGVVSAHGGVAGMAGTWNGTGTDYSLDGQVQGDYAVQMVDALQNDGSVASSVDVAIPGAPDKQLELVFRDTANGFSMSSNEGSGGATCVEKGLCEGYFGDANGNGVAMTLIVDGPNRFRSLKTQLQGFRAVRLYLEKYVRAQANR